MSNRILFCGAEGIGNVIQTIPVVRTIKEILGYDVDYWYAFGSFGIPKIMPYVDKWLTASEINKINPLEYEGSVSTSWTASYLRGLPRLLNAIRKFKPHGESEIDTYMYMARDLGAKEEDLIWYGNCMYDDRPESYDVVIHDGYNRKGDPVWQLKSFPYYKEVVEKLSGLKICSVGSKSEYIPGTDNKTGLPLLDTLGIIKNSSLFLGNDSGLYHCANALGTNNLVIFNFTSTIKNYDQRFHKYATIITREDLDCRPCQNTSRFKTCITRECREIEPSIVVAAVRRKLNGLA